VFGSQATIYAIRERRHLWGTRPGLLLAVSSLIDIAIASTLAAGGIAMTRLPVLLVVGTLVAAAIFTCILDLVKVPVFAHLLGGQPTADRANLPGLVASTPEKQAEPKPEATAADLAPSIAKRAYELYEQGGHQGGAAVQNWEKAEAEIRESLAKSESSRKPRPAANAPASG
jgi:hypothetical protein